MGTQYPDGQTWGYSRQNASNGKDTRTLLHKEVSRAHVLQNGPQLVQNRKVFEALQELVSNDISPSTVLSLFHSPCQQAYLDILEQLQQGFPMQFLINALGSLSFGTAPRPVAISPSAYTLADHEPDHIQHYHEPRWSALSGETLRNSGVEENGYLKVIPTQREPMSQEYRMTLPRSHFTVMRSPRSEFACAEHENLDDFRFKAMLNSDNQVVPSIQRASPQQRDRDSSLPSKPHLPVSQDHLIDQVGLCQQQITSCYNTTTTGASQAAPPVPITCDRLNNLGQIALSTVVTPVKQFIDYTPPVPLTDQYRSPCPLCDQDFMSPREFVSHMLAQHDKPTSYKCLHVRHIRRGSRTCSFETHRLAQLNKHHTEEHANSCSLVKVDSTMTPPCRQDIHSYPSKRVWGCWMCNFTVYSVEAWVDHHMRRHKNCKREQMRWTWRMKSLLSQEATRQLWQEKIDQLGVDSSDELSIEWSETSEDSARAELVWQLERCHYQGRDINFDSEASQDLVMLAMNASIDLTSGAEVSQGEGDSNKRPSSMSLSPPAGSKSHVLRSMVSHRSNANLRSQPSQYSCNEAWPANYSRPCLNFSRPSTRIRSGSDNDALYRA